MKTFTYRQIPPSQLTATDLHAEAATLSYPAAFVITIYEAGFHTSHAEAAEALYSDGRLGIAWGADATWADVEDLETGISMWLNDGAAWEAAH